MKIAQTGDIHWGLGYPGPSPDSRFRDICRVTDWMADRIIEEECDLVLFSGDAFKDARVFIDRASVEIAAFVAWIRKITEAGIPMVAISGTPGHDAVPAYELLKEMRIPGLTVCTEPDIIMVDGVADIACIPGLSRSVLANRDEYKSLSAMELHQLMTDKLTKLAQDFSEDCEFPAILLYHGTYDLADKGFEDVLMQQEPVLTPEAIAGYDLVCLGHIHRSQRNEKVFYCGSPDRLRFDEEKNQPGFWLHEFDDDGQYHQSQFIDTPARRFTTLTPAVESLIEGINFVAIQDAIVRLHYEATQDQAKIINPQALSKQLYDAGAFYVSEIKATIQKTSRVRSVDATAEMTPVQALKLWCEVTELPTEKQAELMPLADELAQEVGAA